MASGGTLGRVFVYRPTLSTSTSTSTSASSAVPDRATHAFDRTNQVRARLGLSPLARDAALDRSAADHTRYLAINDSYASEGHRESIGRPGFSGATPGARAAAHGHTSSRVAENMASASTNRGADSSDALIEAPYHRQAQLGNFAVAGAAAGSGTPAHYVVVFGGVASDFGPAQNQLVVYPAASETAASIDWVADETPNPLPDLAGQRVGFPVSVSAVGGLVVASFTLEDDRGVAVDSRLLTRRTDDGQPLRNYAFVVPLAPLAAGTRYTARVAGSLAGTPFAVDWSFTTAALRPLVMTLSSSALAAVAGATVDIDLTGGTGRYLTVDAVHYSYQSSVASPGSRDSLFSVEATAAGSLRLKRGTGTCSGALSNCRLRVKGQDSAGTEVTATVAIE